MMGKVLRFTDKRSTDHVLTEAEWRALLAKQLKKGCELAGFRSRPPLPSDRQFYHDAMLRYRKGGKVRYAVAYMGTWPTLRVADGFTAREIQEEGFYIVKEGTVLIPWPTPAKRAG